jgi:hypothetical protein
VVGGARAEHEASCPHMVVACDLQGCRSKALRKKLDEHKAACWHRVLKCNQCGKVRMRFFRRS